ncbi:MAG: pca operon transcription factor PcaQ [Rhodobacteraceae bacterium]|nr:pca operon transcription factor PcaQ [Paracoccaceae bacterium]
MLDRRIKLRHIESFVEIVRQRSLKRAAERLYLTQPAISKTLKELEDMLGATLLTRDRGGVALTRQGEVFRHFAEMSLAALQQGADSVDQVARRGKTQLTVGVLPSVAAGLMPRVAAEFTAMAPDTMLRIVDGPHDFLIDRLRGGTLELVIGRLGTPELLTGLSFTQIYNDTVVFVVRPGHPILEAPKLDRVGEFQVIYPPPAAVIRPLVESFLIAHGIGEFPNRLETVSGAFGRVYTRMSDAVWIISRGVVANEMADGRLVALPFETGLTTGPVGLVARPDDEPTPDHRLFRLAVRTVLERDGEAAYHMTATAPRNDLAQGP